ncbi:MAG: LPS export ABC transporter periplasmic protein LptC [Deltaproteobacteria bacterium]|nr:LPS export ABC transporter periplasmic protein LptC [Deltaproteobacteria bacterium]
MKRHWPLLGIALIMGVALFYLAGPSDELPEKIVERDLSGEEGFTLQDIHYSQDNPDEGIRWDLRAKEARITKDRKVISFRDFRLKLKSGNRPSIEIEGGRGEYDKDSGRINLWDNLKGRTENGYRITTDHVQYQQGTACLKTDSTVRITGPAFSVEGKGLYIDLKREFLSLHAGVTTIVKSEGFTL